MKEEILTERVGESGTDLDPSKPYMMWAGTPYEHAMIPVASPK
jgi:hypothetical protein